MTILAVEDDAYTVKLLRFAASECGMPLVATATAEEGVRLAAEQRPRLILMDLHLQGSAYNGIEAISRIRQDPQLRTIPIIAQTAYLTPPLPNEAMAQGADEVLSKPYGLKQLIDTMRKWLDQGPCQEGAA